MSNKTTTHTIQSRRWFLTINNPLKYGYDHNTLKNICSLKFKSIQFFALCDEIGANESTYHTHILLVFNSGVRFSTIKKQLKEAHIDKCRGTIKDCLNYMQKKGEKHADKAETSIKGTYETWGSYKEQKGIRPDMEELFQMITVEKLSNHEILQANNDYILECDKIDKVRSMYLQSQFRDKPRLDLQVIYVYGVTGTGKSRKILEEHGYANVYRCTDYSHPFDNYFMEEVLVLEEFRSSLSISDMLNYLDIYPIQLKARYSNKIACYNYVYICSNIPLEQQYKELQQDEPESWNALLRRIKKVKQYESEEKIVTYNSVEEYLNRSSDFTSINTIPKDEQNSIPFINR